MTSRSQTSPNTELLDPLRIQSARMRRGLSQAELARRLGLTDRTVHRYETVGAPTRMGSKLSETLGFPDRFFERRPCVEFDAKAISFRARRTTTKRQRAAAISAGSFGTEVDLWISQRFGLPDVAVPDMTGESPRIAASLLRNFWGLGAKPLPNLVQLSESKGIRVNGLPDVAASVDAFSLWHGEIPHIFLAQRKTPERARFDLAHEIGHLLLHRRIGPESIEERQADEFASEFLVPTESIFERLRPNPTIDELMKAKRAFGVSAMALTYAVHKAGRMTDWIYRSTCCELARRGFRSGEPEGMTGYERSRVFPHVLASSAHGPISTARIARELALPLEDVHAAMLHTELLGLRSSVSASSPGGKCGDPRFDHSASGSGASHSRRSADRTGTTPRLRLV